MPRRSSRHTAAVEGLVAAAFDGLRERLDGDEAVLDEVEAELSASLDDVLSTAAAGVDAYDGAPTRTADGADGEAVAASHERIAVVEVTERQAAVVDDLHGQVEDLTTD